MDIMPQHWISLVIIFVIIASIVIAYVKKLMMSYTIIIANLIIFVLILFFQDQIIGSSQYQGLGFRPTYLSIQYFPNIYTLFTSMFVHSGIQHIFGNMLVFFFMGAAFEKRVGWKKFLIIYFATGICGALAHSVVDLESSVPLVGASGAIFGIMGAFAYSYPRDVIVMPVPIGITIIMRIKVIYATIIFAAFETIIVALSVNDNTAHFAHIGGLISGAVLAALLIKNKKAKSNSQATVHYDSYVERKPTKINFSNLERLADTKERKDMLNRIEGENVSQVRDIWLEHFLEKAKCPKCGRTVNSFDRKIWCENCGFRTDY